MDSVKSEPQLSIELFDNRESKVIWSDQWQENWEDLSTIKTKLSKGLLCALNSQHTSIENNKSINTEAYKYYLEGKYLYENYSNTNERNKAQELLNKSLDIDDSLLESKLLLAKSYLYNDDSNGIDVCKDLLKEAEQMDNN